MTITNPVPVAFYIEAQFVKATDRIAAIHGDVFASPARVVTIGPDQGEGWVWLVIETSGETPGANAERGNKRTYRLTPTEEISVANPL